MEGTLRIKLGDKVIDIKEFDVSFTPGLIRMEATNFKLHGDFEEAVPVDSPDVVVPKEEKPETPIITQDQILELHKPKNNGE